MSAAKSSRVYDADFIEVGNQRDGADRRKGVRRAPAGQLDALFAATLIDHIVKCETRVSGGYRAAPPMPAGAIYNLRA